MRTAITQFNMLAPTSADLTGCEEIQFVYLAETLQYRTKMMME